MIGSWKLEKIVSDDSVDCLTEKSEVTLEFSSTSEGLQVTGKSYINSYFSYANIDKHLGEMSFEPIGSTKMGGTPFMMNCEASFYQLLSETTSYSLENDKLTLSNPTNLTASGLVKTLTFKKL